MAEDTQNTSPKNDAAQVEAKEDAETRAARRELKQSSISDASASTDKEKTDEKDRPETPDEGDLKDQVASPKKKRAHDQLDSSKDNDDKESVASVDSAKDRTDRSEPEKKRARDEEAKETTDEKKDSDETKDTTEKAQETSASAFAASGFGKLAGSGTSGFGSLGGAKLSGFGSPSKTPLTSFGSANAPSSTTTDAPAAAAPKLTFGGAGSASPFGGLPPKTNGFGSGLGGGSAFSSLGGAKPLSSFGSGGAVKPLPGQKVAKAFGAPESDAEESDEEESEGEGEPETSDNERAASPEKDTGDKKKPKLHKIDVDDGEAGEATLIAVRTKIFAHEKDNGWKERGAGILKINVPNSCVEFEESGAVVAGSFDASGLDDDEGDDGQPKVVRLIMRQDHTHRVILNTAVVPATKFQEKASLKSVSVLFTAFEGDEGKPTAITMRMTAANAKTFMNEIDSVQRELQNR